MRAPHRHLSPARAAFAGIFVVTMLGLVSVGATLPVLPRYVRGKVGTVVLVHGAHVFPDVNAHGGGEDPQWLYTVRFAGRDLWGPDSDPTVSVSFDAFEPYLEAA